MNKKIWLLITVIAVALLVPLISSWTPYENIDLKDYYNITNANFIDSFTMSGNIDMNNNNITDANNIITDNIIGGQSVNTSEYWETSEGILDNAADLNNLITLKEQNITNENWIEDSQEGDLNVNYSDNSDKLDGEEGSYYLDNVNNYVNSVGFSGTDTKTLTLGREGLSDLTASFTDRFEADTNANTECSGTNTFLSGDGTCEADENTQLDDEVPTSNVDMNNKNMTNVDCITFQSGGSICSS